jgi:hypothetical protein
MVLYIHTVPDRKDLMTVCRRPTYNGTTGTRLRHFVRPNVAITMEDYVKDGIKRLSIDIPSQNSV